MMHTMSDADAGLRHGHRPALFCGNWLVYWRGHAARNMRNASPETRAPIRSRYANLGTPPIPVEHFCWDFFKMPYKMPGNSAKLDQ